MTDQKPTGVFVRLPLSDEDKRKVFESSPYRFGFEGAFLSIGTPVTGGELDYCAQIVWHEDAVEPEVAAWRRHDIKKGDNIKVVSQSDALAKLAEKDAEIARYRLALHQIVEAQDRKTEPTYDVLRDCIHFADIALKGGAA